MKSDTVLLFTRNGMGQGPQELQLLLVGKYLALTLESGEFPAKVLFYTDGVKLACQGSPVIEALKKLEALGCELVLCKTCLDTYAMTDQVQVGIVGGMGDILEALQKAAKVISL
ncbi:MAG TPA: DsrE family protein [Anaerolineaceae bacterium]|nr:DsrE family protein [Anaerolineaceae bacterium]